MITNWPLLTIFTIISNIFVFFSITYLVLYSRAPIFYSWFVRSSTWLFGFSSLILAVYRAQRIFLGEAVLAMVPYWAIRDIATLYLILVLLVYFIANHRARGKTLHRRGYEQTGKKQNA